MASSPNPSLEIKAPASPLPERHPLHLDASAPSFIPQRTIARFDPFNTRENLDDDQRGNCHQDSSSSCINDAVVADNDENVDDDDAVLSTHLLNAQLLNDFDIDDMTTPSSTTHAPITTPTRPPTSSIMSTATLSPWNGSSSSWIPAPPESTMKSIWGNDSNNNNNSNDVANGEEWWDRFEPYSREDEKEFDPTLQYYHGALLDTDTIHDINKLSLTDPSFEESQVDNVGEDMSALQMLESIFTDLSEAELTATLEEHGYDLDRATESLFDRKQQVAQAQNQQQQQHVSPPPNLSRKRQVCRHFLAGECYRKDCWFAHDLQVKVCKFWLQGSCLKGDYCEFSHHIDVIEVANKINSQKNHQSTAAKPIRFDESEYPGLQSQKPKKSISPTTPSKNNMTNKPVIEKKLEQEDFPSLSASAKVRTPTSSSTTAAPATTTKPANFAEIAKRKATGSNKSKPVNAKKMGLSMSESRLTQQLKKPVSIPWLITGSALNKEYLKQREQAINYGMLRNRFFSRATAFYLQGDGAKAKAYSNEAKYYNRLMQEMHTEASQRIFEQRNQHEAFIDLHGLHTDEALDMIEERLYKLKNYQGIVYIITGTGHHSGAHSSKQSKLKPSVDEFLQQQNYRFAETSIVGDNKGGIFAVDLASCHLQRS
ncbi:hypothetical protein BDB00DRAFT_387692 [Zychaea mexicana]|uniref:uncharacterized protein n=1 Tax=Zychaea mexicana TaxID=64656 RepID=UPI0022FEAE5B|nr:uncharacterized protein BDB00DRAFT_387692 [Zychaea mexicana]KAI9493169.1 hypothetical protein BDB00DRAFT_387692 [Zychaea mexicana]